MTTISMTVVDATTFPSPGLTVTGDTGTTSAADVLAAYRAADQAYVQVQIGTDPKTQAPVYHVLTDAETMKKIVGTALGGIMGNVDRYKLAQAQAAVVVPPKATATVS